jgi:hypothetical protein
VSRLTSWLCSVLAVFLDRWARVSRGTTAYCHIVTGVKSPANAMFEHTNTRCGATLAHAVRT